MAAVPFAFGAASTAVGIAVASAPSDSVAIVECTAIVVGRDRHRNPSPVPPLPRSPADASERTHPASSTIVVGSTATFIAISLETRTPTGLPHFSSPCGSIPSDDSFQGTQGQFQSNICQFARTKL